MSEGLPDTSDTGSFQAKNKAFRLFRKEHAPVDSTSRETTSVVRKREKQFVSARMLLGCARVVLGWG